MFTAFGHDGLNKQFDNERDAYLCALDWAGDDMDAAVQIQDTEILKQRLSDIIEKTGEPIGVRVTY